MKKKKFLLLLLVVFTNILKAQTEVSIGYSVNKNLADGPAISFAYDIKLKAKFSTKSQLGYKHLYHFNDFVGCKIRVDIAEFHQTLSYDIIQKKKFILKPNLGINYRYYKWNGLMLPPYNSLPQRVFKVEFRDDWLRLNSFDPVTQTDGNIYDTYSVSNLGFSIQIQSQFRINNRIWLHITPFLEPDYDGTQNTGGVYVGLIFKKFK